ncbi:MAG TPA: glycosyltransferase family 4 protein [Longimicrobiales bacterium]|nr:glycosyltransferase family 4 protein [Longimicrobiales bacterium]
MHIAICVHGRFSAFGIATGFMELGEDVTVYTNYPRWVLPRFGIPTRHVKSLLVHGVATRLLHRAGLDQHDTVEAIVKKAFGRWVASQTRGRRYDAIDCWSGCAEEAFISTDACKVLTRSSAHIQVQSDLLKAESERAGVRVDQPGEWIIERELREYSLADVIVVPSMFAASTFAGTPNAAKVRSVPLTAAGDRWRPDSAVVDERLRRITSRNTLRVLYVGAVSHRKGILDLLAMARARPDMEFRLVGGIQPECRALMGHAGSNVRSDGHVVESDLRSAYAWADIFFFPSIEDGFGVVLAQAQASAVPFVSTRNTGAPDLLQMGGRGWVVDVRDRAAMLERLQYCDENREELAEMVRQLYAAPIRRSWKDVAFDELAAMKSFPRA